MRHEERMDAGVHRPAAPPPTRTATPTRSAPPAAPLPARIAPPAASPPAQTTPPAQTAPPTRTGTPPGAQSAKRTDAAKRARRAVLAAVRGAGGVMRVSDLREAGHPRRTVQDLCDEGVLTRPRQGWIAGPNADPLLVTAAAHGVVVTCITQAKRLGLWVSDTGDRPHLGARSHAGRVGAPHAHIHWGAPLVPRPRSAVVDGIESVLVFVAKCQPYEHALAVWESALQKGLVQTEALERYALPPSARRLLAEAQPWSDSGLETFVVPRLRWLRLPLHRQIWILGHRVDLLIGDKLVLQIDGGTHVGPQREEDIGHDALLRLHGYHVIRVGYRQVMFGWAEVQELIMRAVAQGLHR